MLDTRVETVLGVDPGAVHIGYGVVRGSEALEYGVLSPHTESDTMNGKTIEQLWEMLKFFTRLVFKHEVGVIVCEQVPGVPMSQRDRVLATEFFLRVFCMEHRIEYVEVQSRQVKKAATGLADASKKMVQEKVLESLQGVEVEGKMLPDQFDALALAYWGRGLGNSWIWGDPNDFRFSN